MCLGTYTITGVWAWSGRSIRSFGLCVQGSTHPGRCMREELVHIVILYCLVMRVQLDTLLSESN